MDGVIYLIADNTKKVYLYDPDANIWQKVSFICKMLAVCDRKYIFNDNVSTNDHWLMVP